MSNRYERENNKVEEKKILNIADKAKEYRYELQKLIDINFDNPNEELKAFAEKSKMDLKDPKVKKHFMDIKHKYLEDINKFYEKNFNPSEFNNKRTISNTMKKKINGNNLKNNNSKNTASVKKNIDENKKNDERTNQTKNANASASSEKTPAKNSREFLKPKINGEESLYDKIKKNISPQIFCCVFLFSLILMYFKNNKTLE